MPKLLTTEQFIQRSKSVHGDKYDYSKSVYIHGKRKVQIKCIAHNEYFYQPPANHLSGRGCMKCGIEKNASKNRTGLQEFIAKSRKVHGDIYGYDDVKYKNIDTSVVIYCNIHGLFSQTPYKHLIGRGCPECGGSKRLTTSKFIDRSVAVHGFKYDYSNAIYKNKDSIVSIICKVHGEFNQTPHAHVSGKSGCPKCAIEKTGRYLHELSDEQKESTAKLYVVKVTPPDGKVFHKVGYTTKKINQRYYSHVKKGFLVNAIVEIDTNRFIAQSIELDIVKYLNRTGCLYKCHYFKNNGLNGWTECYYPSDESSLAINDIINKHLTTEV